MRLPEFLPLVGALSLPLTTVPTPEAGDAVLSSTTLGIAVRASIVHKWPRGWWNGSEVRWCDGKVVRWCGDVSKTQLERLSLRLRSSAEEGGACSCTQLASLYTLKWGNGDVRAGSLAGRRQGEKAWAATGGQAADARAVGKGASSEAATQNPRACSSREEFSQGLGGSEMDLHEVGFSHRRPPPQCLETRFHTRAPTHIDLGKL